MLNYLLFILAAAFEIAGCYTAWMWLRLGSSVLWVIPGLVSLSLFALVLTRIDTEFAGRAYAAYGGIYIVSSLVWLAIVEHTKPGLPDLLGVGLCLAGASVILFGPLLASLGLPIQAGINAATEGISVTAMAPGPNPAGRPGGDREKPLDEPRSRAENTLSPEQWRDYKELLLSRDWRSEFRDNFRAVWTAIYYGDYGTRRDGWETAARNFSAAFLKAFTNAMDIVRMEDVQADTPAARALLGQGQFEQLRRLQAAAQWVLNGEGAGRSGETAGDYIDRIVTQATLAGKYEQIATSIGANHMQRLVDPAAGKGR